MSIDQTTKDTRELLTSWATALCFIFFVGCLWFVYVDTLPTIRGIITDEPLLRLYPLSVMMPCFAIALVVGYTALILRAIPVREQIIRKLKPWVVSVFWLLPVSFLIGSALGFLQHHYFPKNGYTECDQLQGAPSVWFTDWVKNPAWCVKGKDRAWVFEQARIAGEGKTPNPETTK
jgi:hypothetical protein